MNRGLARVFSAAVLSLTCQQASAFPLLIAGAGAGMATTLFIPGLIALALAWVVFSRYKAAAQWLSVTLVALLSASLTYVAVTPSWKESALEMLADGAEVASPTITVRFEFLSDDKQAELLQAMPPAAFVEGFLKDQFTVIWLDKYRDNIFSKLDRNRLPIEDVSDDPGSLLDIIDGSPKPVVLIDETGALAGSVARDLGEFLGVAVSFLQGGTNALNKELWDNWSIQDDPGALSLNDWQPFLAENHGAGVLSVVVPDEFLNDGWVHGDLAAPIAAYLSGIDAVSSMFEGRQLLISGAENTFTGHTWLLVHKLRAMGFGVSFIEPTRHEKLIKPAYVSSYQGADIILPLDEGMLISELLSDVVYLDFRASADVEKDEPWYGDVLYVGMEAVAQGRLADIASELDLERRYMGVAYDKRTLYHAILAGEQVVKRGGVWLGVAVHPSALDSDVERLTFLGSPAQYTAVFITTCLGLIGASIIAASGGASLPLFALALMAGLAWHAVRSPARWPSFLVVALAAHSVMVADGWLIHGSLPLSWSMGLLLLGYALGGLLCKLFNARPGKPSGDDLPAKISLLLKAKRLGFTVLPLRAVDRVSFEKEKSEKLDFKHDCIVRSAASSESASGLSAGVYESRVVRAGENVWPAVEKVLQVISESGEANPVCFIQPHISDALFGVAMFGSGPDSHLILGEYGLSDSITAGRGKAASVSIPVWDVKKVKGNWVVPVNILLTLNRELGATGIEFAIEDSGRFVLLQVVTEHHGRESLSLLLSNRHARVAVADQVHDTPAEAAIYAAMAVKGEQLSAGNHRLVIEHRLSSAISAFSDDCYTLLGEFTPWYFLALPAQQLKVSFDKLDRERACYRNTVRFDLSAETCDLISIVRHEVASTRALYGRFSRLTTLAGEFLGVRLGGRIDESISEIKARCSAAFCAEFSWLKPVVDEICVRGEMRALNFSFETSISFDDPALSHSQALLAGSVVKLIDILSANHTINPAVTSWAIPKSGLHVRLSSPAYFEPGDALFIQETDMKHLPLLRQASAVVATHGSALSHLMQHARSLRVPYVVGADVRGQVGLGRRPVVVKPCGEVRCA